MTAIKLVAGLGNPGPDYAGTRHNLGFFVVEACAREWGASWKNWSGIADVAAARDPGVILVRPRTFMNNSGEAVRGLASFHRIEPEAVLVVIDDFSLPLGSLRLRLSGSAGGHNGLDSVIQHAGTSAIPRLRLGIGPVPPGTDPADFVLSRFKKTDIPVVEAMVEDAARLVGRILAEGIERAVSSLAPVKRPEKADA